jgi:pimeloyl-ACP methyl ester carboxylesterase
MHTTRIHRAISADGTQIAGRVLGRGRPLVLVHGALYDGETAWTGMLPHLTDRFRCFLPSTRGKGLSAASPELTRQRLVEDVLSFIESIGEPVALAGWSGGGMLALGAAAHSDAVSAVVAYEPAVFETLGDDGAARFADAAARMAGEARRGRLLEAARIFNALVANEEEREAVRASGRLELAAPNIPTELEMFGQILRSREPSPTDPALLASITVPVLLLQGERTHWHRWFGDGIRHVAEHVADCEVRTLPGAGHGAPGIMPAAVAAELARFLAAVPAAA